MCFYKMFETMRNVHIVSLIGVICVVQTMAQLCPYVHKACMKCDEDSVTCNNLTQIPPLNTGANVYPSKRLIFMGGTINSISKATLPPGLSVIYMEGLPLTNISEDAFDNSGSTLRRIHFGDAQFHSLPKALKQLTTLGELSIKNTRINHWESALLKQTAHRLEYLKLKNVSLSSWPSWISDFGWLLMLDLSNNSLLRVPDDAFGSARKSLRKLYLSGCGLTHMPQALSMLSNLKYLDLSRNKFTDVYEIQKIIGYSFARDLAELSLASTGISEVANFSSLTSLTFINLDNNRILKIPPCSLPSSLTKLYLSYNQLSSVPKDISGMSKLAMLHMTNNLISTIEPNSFPSSLEYLMLTTNKLTKIEGTTFKNLTHLLVLTLDKNPISQISPAAFSDLTSLAVLIIGSQLAAIPLAFTKLRPFVIIFFSTSKELSCPCPAPQELVHWFNSGVSLRQIPQNCSNGQSVFSYLGGQCG